MSRQGLYVPKNACFGPNRHNWNTWRTPSSIMWNRNHLLDHPYVLLLSFGKPRPSASPPSPLPPFPPIRIYVMYVRPLKGIIFLIIISLIPLKQDSKHATRSVKIKFATGLNCTTLLRMESTSETKASLSASDWSWERSLRRVQHDCGGGHSGGETGVGQQVLALSFFINIWTTLWSGSKLRYWNWKTPCWAYRVRVHGKSKQNKIWHDQKLFNKYVNVIYKSMLPPTSPFFFSFFFFLGGGGASVKNLSKAQLIRQFLLWSKSNEIQKFVSGKAAFINRLSLRHKQVFIKLIPFCHTTSVKLPKWS